MKIPEDIGALMLALDHSYGHMLRRFVGVDFHRAGSLPYIGVEDGKPYVDLVSLDWGTRARVSLHLSEMQKVAVDRPATIIADRIETAAKEVQEPPPFWVG